MFATVQSAFKAANEIFRSKCNFCIWIDVKTDVLFSLQCYFYDVTMNTFRFVNTHLTTSNKGELANENAAYKIIALECSFDCLKQG